MKTYLTTLIFLLISISFFNLQAQSRKEKKIIESEALSSVYNFDLNISSLDESLNLNFDITDESTRGTYYALLIGVDNYESDKFKDLEQPVKDAFSLRKVLTELYTFEDNNITILSNPKRSEILDALEILKAKLKSTDNLLIFYAGHGKWDEKLGVGYWIPADATPNASSWLPNSAIQDYMKGMDTRHTLLIADACFSGSIFKQQTRGFDMLKDATPAIQQLYNDKSRRAITSGNLAEVPDRSIFIEYLVKELRRNKDIYLPSYRLYGEFRETVLNQSSGKQNPLTGVIEGTKDEGGDFIFIRKR